MKASKIRPLSVAHRAIVATAVSLALMLGITTNAAADETTESPTPAPTVEPSDPVSIEPTDDVPVSEEPSDTPEPEESETPDAPETPTVMTPTVIEPTEDPSPSPTPAPKPPPYSTTDKVKVGDGVKIGHGWTAANTVYPGDWNKDGHTDLMLVYKGPANPKYAYGDLLLYASRGVNQFHNPVKIGNGWSRVLDVLGGVDWDGDGNVDLIGRFSSGDLYFYKGNGRGGIVDSWKVGYGWSTFKTITPMVKGPGGKPALVGLRANGEALIYPTNGRPVFQTPYTTASNWVGFRVLQGVADWDNNGRSDLLAIDADNVLRYIASDGNAARFSHYRIGYGWAAAQTLTASRSNGVTHIWTILRDGTLMAYKVATQEPPPPPPPPKVDSRCMTGRVLCASKTTKQILWMIDGKVIETMDARYGRPGLDTREGTFQVFRKSRHHVSGIYGTAMPWAMFFSGGQAVHYSADFARRGHVGGSAGCINVRDAAAIDRVYSQVRIGDKVVVYR